MATKRKKPGPGGRPPLEFDLSTIRGLGQILATRDEMAAVLDCSVTTVETRMRSDEEFLRAYKKGEAAGKIALRRTQSRLALGSQAVFDEQNRQVEPARTPNVTMLIWLGKQWLGQRDQMQVDASIEDRTGVAHVPPEVTLAHWEEKFGSIEHDVGDPEEEAN